MGLRRAYQQVSDYAIEFSTLATDSGWNSPSLLDAFYNRLVDSIKDQLVSHDCPLDLDSFIV